MKVYSIRKYIEEEIIFNKFNFFIFLFLNPGNNTFLNTAWSDELTGKSTLEGKGVNQIKQTSVQNPNKSDDYYITQNLYSNGTPGAVDNGLLGIKSIRMDVSTSFLPQIYVELEDVKVGLSDGELSCIFKNNTCINQFFWHWVTSRSWGLACRANRRARRLIGVLLAHSAKMQTFMG